MGGSGSRREKVSYKHGKRFIDFIFLKFWMLSFESFSCSLDISKFKFFIKKRF